MARTLQPAGHDRRIGSSVLFENEVGNVSMKHNFLLRGRDVTTLLLALWASIFAYVGFQTFVQGGPLLPVVLYGDPQAISMRFGIPYVLAWLGFWSQGHMV